MSSSSDADAVDSPTAETAAVGARAASDEPTTVRETATPTSAAPDPESPPRPMTAAIADDPGAADEPSKLQSLIAEKPELLVLGAFAGGLVLAIIIRRLGH